jgi:DNA modification methylase
LIWKGEIIWEKNNYNCKYCTWGSWQSPSSLYLKYSWEFIEIFCKNTLKKDGDKKNIDITGDEFKKWVYGTETTTKVARELERRFIGIDIDVQYCRTAERRLKRS